MSGKDEAFPCVAYLPGWVVWLKGELSKMQKHAEQRGETRLQGFAEVARFTRLELCLTHEQDLLAETNRRFTGVFNTTSLAMRAVALFPRENVHCYHTECPCDACEGVGGECEVCSGLGHSGEEEYANAVWESVYNESLHILQLVGDEGM